MYIVFCIGFILVGILELFVYKCLKDIYDRLELLEHIIYFSDIGDSDE